MRLQLLIATLLILSTGAHADVLRVAPFGGTHTNMQTAVDDAQDGDIVLVDAAFSTFNPGLQFIEISAKALTIVGDSPTPVAVAPFLINDLTANQAVVLRNLEFRSLGVDLLIGGVVSVRDCAGPVHIEDAVLHGLQPLPLGTGGPALRVSKANAVTLVRSSVVGGDGASTLNQPPFVVWTPTTGGVAATLIEARVVFHDCTISGGDGGSDGLFGLPGTNGRFGIDMLDSQAWLIGCEVSGGDHGFGTPGGVPAAAVSMDGATSGLRVLGSSLTGGTGAVDVAQTAGTRVDWPGSAMSLTLGAPVRPGDTSTIAVTGPAGTLFGLFYSFGAGFQPKTSLHGVLQGDLGTFGGPLFLTTMPPSGEFELTFEVPAIGGLDGFLKVDQVISSQGEAGLVLSNASAYVQIENGL